jgi:hypothetical protein
VRLARTRLLSANTPSRRKGVISGRPLGIDQEVVEDRGPWPPLLASVVLVLVALGLVDGVDVERGPCPPLLALVAPVAPLVVLLESVRGPWPPAAADVVVTPGTSLLSSPQPASKKRQTKSAATARILLISADLPAVEKRQPLCPH